MPGPIPNVANDQAECRTVYDFDGGWNLAAGELDRHRQAGADTLSDLGQIIIASLPSYVTIDAMVAYPVTDKLSLVLNGYNLANTFYYANSCLHEPTPRIM